MRKQTVLVLGVIAAALLAFIVFFERNTLSTREVEARRGRVLERFVRSRATQLELTRGDDTITMVRDREEDETLSTFDVGTWRITAPIAVAAETDSVDSLLTALEYLEARRTLSDISSEDRQHFGLDAPRATLRFTVANETTTLLVGADADGQGGLYVALEGDARAFLVGQDFFEAVDHGIDHFRSKELFGDFAAPEARGIHLVNHELDATLERSGGRWFVRAPFDALARTQNVDPLIDTFLRVRAARFLAETADDASRARFGVGDAAQRLEITRRAPVGDAELPSVGMRVGGACPEHADELVVAVDRGPIVCVRSRDLTSLDVALDALRERRLFVSQDDQVDRLEFADVPEPFDVRRVDSDWKLRRGGADSEADASAVADYMQLTRGAEADSYEPATEASLASHGLAGTHPVVRLHRTSEDYVEEVHVGSLDTVGVWVRRGDEAVITHFTGPVAEALIARPTYFASRTLVDRATDRVASVEITRGAVVERIARTDTGGYRIEAPAGLNADANSTDALARSIATLHALRWVSESAEPSQGLDAPRVVVHAMIDADAAAEGDPSRPLDVTFEIGAPTEGGAFARRRGEPAVFVLATEFVDQVVRPLVDRDVIALPTTEVTGIVYERDGARVELTKTADGSWSVGGGPANGEAVQALIDRLGSLRGRPHAYGATAPFVSPGLRVTLRRDAGDAVLEVGELGLDGEGAWYHARRPSNGIDVELSRETVDALRAFEATPR